MKFLILGFVRSGTTGLAHYLNFLSKNLKVGSKATYQKEFEAFKKYERFKFDKNKFFIFTPWKKKLFSQIKKKDILTKKVLISHYFNKKILEIFKDREIILIIRRPIDAIFSLINFTTQKHVIRYNKKYKIFSVKKLISNRKIINNHIKHYETFNINFYNSKFSSKIKVLKYESFKKIKNKNKNFNIKFFNDDKYHSTSQLKVDKANKEYLKKNYDFARAEKIYKKITKLKRFKFYN